MNFFADVHYAAAWVHTVQEFLTTTRLRILFYALLCVAPIGITIPFLAALALGYCVMGSTTAAITCPFVGGAYIGFFGVLSMFLLLGIAPAVAWYFFAARAWIFLGFYLARLVVMGNEDLSQSESDQKRLMMDLVGNITLYLLTLVVFLLFLII